MQKGIKSHKQQPRILAVLQQLHADRPACGNHKSKPWELCLQNQILRWCWPHTLLHRTSFFQLLGEPRKRQIWITLEASEQWHKAKMLCVFSTLLGVVSEHASSDTTEGRWAQAGLYPESIPKWIFFFGTGYLQSFSTINSGIREYKQLAVSQHCGRVTSNKLATIMLCIFCDPEKGAHPVQCWVSIWDARSIRLLTTSLTSLTALKINLIHETFPKPYYGLALAFQIFPALCWKALPFTV